MTANYNDPQAGQGRPLPKKEGDLFKSVIKHYECKQYKKGVKAAETILKKFPNHGETLAMKGLTMNCMGKREEAHEFVRKGLMKDMRSHVCWHVFGLLHRSDRNYNEAIKAYKQALKIDPGNLQILRDLSLLQVQMRDLQGFALTRHTILTQKPNNKIHWLAYALAKHLTNDVEGAVNVIDIYLGTLTDSSPEKQRGFESSELALYRNKLLTEIPNNEEKALQHLEECKHVVVDEGSWLQTKAELLLKMSNYDAGKDIYISLLKRGLTENYSVHNGYMCAVLQLDKDTFLPTFKRKGTNTIATLKQLTSEQKQTLLQSYQKEIKQINTRSRAYKSICLTLLEGDDVKATLDSYCRYDLSKGTPSLGSDLRSLFLIEDKNGLLKKAIDPLDVKVHPKFKMITELVDGYLDSLTTSNSFPGNKEQEPPSTLLWTMYLRSYLYELCGEYTQALEMIDKCLEHTPTLVDLYERKGRILKLSGDINAAANCLDTGRDLDKQDRYINNKTTKYLLRANRDDDARKTISLFTVHEGNPEQNLYDMQCTWYELELAACYARKGQWGLSLKKFMAVEKHFEDFHEDQFDFHSYCIRKVTLRTYTDVLKWEDNLWSQKCYCQAAEGIINGYLHLYDNPKDALTGDEEPDYSNMNAAQKKKAKAIYRKKKKAAEKKAEQEKADAAQALKENGEKRRTTRPVKVDPDPKGDLLLKRNHLEEAKKYVSTLVKNAPNVFSTWILQYDVSIRRNKKLMSLQALFKAQSIDASNSQLFDRILDFYSKSLNDKNDSTKAIVKEIIIDETKTLMGNKTISEFVSEAYKCIKNDPLTDLPMRVSVMKGLISTNTGTLREAISLVIDGGLDGKKVTISNCKKAIKSLESLGKDAEDAKMKFISMVREKYPIVKNLD